MSKIHITPETKVSELLDAYPELEPTLIAIAPAFAKLRNPVLRKTVARITSLSQAARVGNVSIGELVNRLRREVGQDQVAVSSDDSHPTSIAATAPPSWYKPEAIWKSLDARPLIEAGEHPVSIVISDLKEMPAGMIYELVAPFVPAPLIDLIRSKGHDAWTREEPANVFRTYFAKI